MMIEHLTLNQSSIMYEATDLAYLAAFIDAEGCFSIGLFDTKSHKGNITRNYHTYLRIYNTDGAVKRWIDDTFDVTDSSRCVARPKKQVDKIIHNVQITGKKLNKLLPLIYPYLIVKKAHCEIMMNMRETFPEGKRLSTLKNNDEINNLRYSYMLEMRKLNSQFYDRPLKEPNALAPCCPVLPKWLVGDPSQSKKI